MSSWPRRTFPTTCCSTWTPSTPEFPQADVVLVVGANDVVNPAARHDQRSPIYGMPTLGVDQARSVVVVKRSMRSGFVGIANELFYFGHDADALRGRQGSHRR